MKLLILGYGMVGSSVFDLLTGEGIFPPGDIYMADRSDEARERFVSHGGEAGNAFRIDVNSKNYMQTVEKLSAGDILLGLADGIDSCALLEVCCKRGIHYLSTADGSFEDAGGETCDTEEMHLAQALQIGKRYPHAATSILQFGCNPGLVSVMVKKALRDIVAEDDGEFVTENRVALDGLLRRNDFPGLAGALSLRTIIETDLDSTATNIKEENNAIYSTWNVRDFEMEMNRPATFMVGTEGPERTVAAALETAGLCSPDAAFRPGRMVLNRPAKEACLKAVSKNKHFEGYILPHEELFSIYRYLTVKGRDGRPVYSPSVLFLYRPCELALRSLFHEKNEKFVLITNDRVLSGNETVGVLLTGDNFRTRFVYTSMAADHSRSETPTVFQVSASLLGAIKYVIAHRREGVLLPEDVPDEELLASVGRHLPIFSGTL